MPIKAILSDFDGTLVNLEGFYDPRIPPLLKQFLSKKIHFSIATGRPYHGLVKKYIKELAIDDFHIFHGGGMIINTQSGDTPWLHYISDTSVQKIYDHLRTYNLFFSLEDKNTVYMPQIINTPAYSKDYIIRKTVNDEIPQKILKILLFALSNKLNEQDVNFHIKKIQSDCKDVFIIKIQKRGYFGFDVTSEKATKHTAVLEYARILGIQSKELIGIGDGHNDYPLFTACGYKIAMGDAPNELKEIADKIVKPVDEGGMVEALEHISSIIQT